MSAGAIAANLQPGTRRSMVWTVAHVVQGEPPRQSALARTWLATARPVTPPTTSNPP